MSGKIKIHEKETEKNLIEYGFTNHHKSSLYFCRDLGDNVSFNLTVDKKTLEIKSIDILDEDFLQPYDYQAILAKNKNHKFAKKIYNKVNDIMTKLQNDGIITGFKVGMYI